MSLYQPGEAARASERSRAEQLLSQLAELAGSSSAELSPVEAGRRVLRRGMAAIGAVGGSAHVVALGASIDIVEDGPRRSSLAAVSEAIARGEEAWLSTVQAIDARFPGGAAQGALALVRLEIGGQCAGGLALRFDEERDFPESERSFLRTLGRILLQEVDRASLHMRQREADRDREKKARWAEALSDAFRLIASPASLKHILDELARVSCETPADFSAIRVLSDGGQSLDFRGLYHRDRAQGEILRSALEKRAMPANLGRTARVLESGMSLLVPEVDMEELLRAYAGTPFGDYVARFPLRTIMVVPLRARGTVFGVVTVARTNTEPFQEADLRFVEEVADRAAAALDNANLIEKLERSEEQLRVALEAGRLGAWDWDIPARRVTWSTMLEKIDGLAAGSFAGTFEAYQHDMHTEDSRARSFSHRAERRGAHRLSRHVPDHPSGPRGALARGPGKAVLRSHGDAAANGRCVRGRHGATESRRAAARHVAGLARCGPAQGPVPGHARSRAS